MKIAKISAPLAIAGCLALTGCNFGTDASSDNKSSGDATQSAAPTSGDSKPSEETKSESPSSETSSESSTESSSESPSSSESSSSSSSSSPSVSSRLSQSDLNKYASANDMRACPITDMQYGTGMVQFCGTDNKDITAKYKGQRIYFTQATSYTKGATYSVEVEKDGKKQSQTFDNLDSAGKGTTGMPLTLSAPMSINSAGDYKVTFKKNGSDIKSETYHIALN